MRRLLIANRGEIACRIAAAARDLGIETVAVYSEADAAAKHVEMADHAVLVGSARPQESYLDADRVLAAALESGADAVHPGYGFLAERADFAEKVIASGLTWVGPSPESILRMGAKGPARAFAKSLGIPILEGSPLIHSDMDESEIHSIAQQMGYPILVKASGGGGGIGMRRVESADGLLQAIQSTQTLAERAFGDSAVYLERCIDSARHVEVQVFGFGNGKAVHLFERDCSMQRRYQKVIEEAPAFAISRDLVENLCGWSVQLAASQNYSGAGTVEFIVDSETQAGYFLEMNTRIQVEHPVTELVYDKDLVQLQLLHASGRDVEPELDRVSPLGHAIECRIYAEKPHKNFMPRPGVLSRFEFPDPKGVLRLDTGVRAGDAITPYYDPMLAKCIVHAASRDQAINDMVEILELAQVEGVETNIRFLIAALSSEEFRQGGHDTKFIEQSVKRLLQ